MLDRKTQEHVSNSESSFVPTMQACHTIAIGECTTILEYMQLETITMMHTIVTDMFIKFKTTTLLRTIVT